MNGNLNWYAFHLYRNSRKQFIAKLELEKQRYYVAEKVVYGYGPDSAIPTTRTLLFPSIVFVRCTANYVESIRRDPYSQASAYTYPGTRQPAVIDDTEMDNFMFVLNTACRQVDVVDLQLAKGDRVRVLDGVFKGAQGYIVRIKGDHRFVVSLKGVAAVATTYIPQKFLEKIENDETGTA